MLTYLKRFTIGRLMIAVLVAGLGLWGFFTFWPHVAPSMAERQAEALYKQAKLTREVAEYAIREYSEGIYLQDLATYQGQVATAKSDLDRANDRLKWSTSMVKQGRLSPAITIADQLSKEHAEFELAQANTQLTFLDKHTKPKQVKSLENDLARARLDEQAKLATYRAERAKRWWYFKL